jgi:hypothetical protein
MTDPPSRGTPRWNRSALLTAAVAAGAVLATMAAPEASDALAPGTYVGSTSQGQSMRITVFKGGRLSFHLTDRQRCSRGGAGLRFSTPRRRIRLNADGRFGYSESGRVRFPAVGSGRYRFSMGGRVRPRSASGTYESRFRGKRGSCHSGLVDWWVEPGCTYVGYARRFYPMRKNGVSCDFARRWVRRLHARRAGPPGWRCASRSRYRVDGRCARGQRYFNWHMPA